MKLPDDFDTRLSKIERLGILDENADSIHARFEDVLRGVGSVEASRQLGVADWASDTLRDLKRAVHQEICDPHQGGLKEGHAELLDKALTPEGITAVAAVVGTIVAGVNPACFLTSVILYLTIWLLKVGLNEWCALPVVARA